MSLILHALITILKEIPNLDADAAQAEATQAQAEATQAQNQVQQIVNNLKASGMDAAQIAIVTGLPIENFTNSPI